MMREHDSMDLEQLATYLHRDVREVSKLANRGHLPGQKVGGEWRFAPAEINSWIETQLSTYSELELTALEKGPGRGTFAEGLLVTALLTESTIAVPLAAGTRASVLKELVNLAELSWQVYDPDAMLTAIQEREERGSTALVGGVALLHPRRRLPYTVQGEAFIAFGKTGRGIPFGAPDGGLTDLFFLVCCPDQPTHLRTLARLSRMLMRPGLLDELRSAETAAEMFQILELAERELI